MLQVQDRVDFTSILLVHSTSAKRGKPCSYMQLTGAKFDDNLHSDCDGLPTHIYDPQCTWLPLCTSSRTDQPERAAGRPLQIQKRGKEHLGCDRCRESVRFRCIMELSGELSYHKGVLTSLQSTQSSTTICPHTPKTIYTVSGGPPEPDERGSPLRLLRNTTSN